VVPLYQSVLSGLLIGLKGEIGGSLRVCPIIKCARPVPSLLLTKKIY